MYSSERSGFSSSNQETFFVSLSFELELSFLSNTPKLHFSVLLRPNLHAILTPFRSGSLKSTPLSTSHLSILKLTSKHAMLIQSYSGFLGTTPPFLIQCSNTSTLSDLHAST
ncbi:hypothetical protein AX774_g6163 [Zancudomyces culisetae]|uniref:Uncharacterized protein n=1 Tax=Zancudomyces culisetae TaxID=1213189 RepID=A0A1R1PHR5_ZANCU|nr:hypothetical protein AX774_g6163 [Zancudomyces culisetae]|eukprot:OMH80402.1 hypothetical protein AX774_g6163 [Zancudomyces culisetae]